MGTPVEDSGTEAVLPGGEEVPDSTGINPNWESVLSLLPDNYRSVVTPHFQKWDQEANGRIESVKEQYKNYQPFVDHGISSDQITQGIRLLQMVDQQPRTVLDAIAQQLGVTVQEVKEAIENEEPENIVAAVDPNLARLQQGFELLAQKALNEENSRAEEAANRQLESDLAAIEAKHGKYIPDLLLPYLSSALDKGLTIEKAAEQYFSIQGQIQQPVIQQPYAPNLLGGNSGAGSGLPSNRIDPRKLDDRGTQALVIEMLKANASRPT